MKETHRKSFHPGLATTIVQNNDQRPAPAESHSSKKTVKSAEFRLYAKSAPLRRCSI